MLASHGAATLHRLDVSDLSPRPPSELPFWASRRVVGALLVVLAIIAVLVVAGAFTAIDQYAINHLMPWLHPPYGGGANGWGGLILPYSGRLSLANATLAVWTYPCSVFLSGLVVFIAALVAIRRGSPWLAVALLVVWGLGNAVELIGKGLLRRPTLYGPGSGARAPILAFDNSFPSGHMIRGMLVVTAVWLVWPRLRLVALAWFLPVGPFLVVTAAHTPSDVLGGLVVGTTLISALVVVLASPPLSGSGSGTWARLSPRSRRGRASVR